MGRERKKKKKKKGGTREVGNTVLAIRGHPGKKKNYQSANSGGV